MRIHQLIIICTALVVKTYSLSGQTFQKVTSFPLKNTPTQVSIDRQGNFFIADKKGNIDKYSPNGKPLQHFSPQKVSTPSIIEAWQGLRSFVFYREFQEYLFLDRFLNPSPRYTFAPEISQFISLATMGNGSQLWVVDGQQLSLKRIDTHSKEIQIDVPLNLHLNPDSNELTYLRSYQNFVFLADKVSGILVFDNLGNYLETFPFSGVDFFTFSGNELILSYEDRALFYDIYKKTKKEVALPNLSYKFILVANNLIAINNNIVDVYQVN